QFSNTLRGVPSASQLLQYNEGIKPSVFRTLNALLQSSGAVCGCTQKGHAYHQSHMKNRLRNILRMLAVTVALAVVDRAAAGEPTAYELAKEGNKHVGEAARDRIVQTRSEKSVGTMTPNIWHIVFYDPYASLKATAVTFG